MLDYKLIDFNTNSDLRGNYNLFIEYKGSLNANR